MEKLACEFPFVPFRRMVQMTERRKVGQVVHLLCRKKGRGKGRLISFTSFLRTPPLTVVSWVWLSLNLQGEGLWKRPRLKWQIAKVSIVAEKKQKTILVISVRTESSRKCKRNDLHNHPCLQWPIAKVEEWLTRAKKTHSNSSLPCWRIHLNHQETPRIIISVLGCQWWLCGVANRNKRTHRLRTTDHRLPCKSPNTS